MELESKPVACLVVGTRLLATARRDHRLDLVGLAERGAGCIVREHLPPTTWPWTSPATTERCCACWGPSTCHVPTAIPGSWPSICCCYEPQATGSLQAQAQISPGQRLRGRLHRTLTRLHCPHPQAGRGEKTLKGIALRPPRERPRAESGAPFSGRCLCVRPDNTVVDHQVRRLDVRHRPAVEPAHRHPHRQPTGCSGDSARC